MRVDRVSERPGGRSAEVRGRVLQALRQLVDEQPGATPTIADVASRAGVSRSTVHRRWGSMTALLADLAMAEMVPADEQPHTVSGVRQWAADTAATLNAAPAGQSAFARVIGYLGKLDTVEDRQAFGVELLKAMAPVDSSATDPFRMLDLVELVFAPMYLQHLMGTAPIGENDIDRLCGRFERLTQDERRRQPPVT